MALDWITIKDIFKMLYWALSLAIFSRRPFSVMINKVNAHIESNKLTCFSDIFMIFSDIIHVTFSLIGGVVSEPWYVQYDVISIRKITSVKSGCNDYFRILEIADVKENIRRPKYVCAKFFFFKVVINFIFIPLLYFYYQLWVNKPEIKSVQSSLFVFRSRSHIQ